jgi:hypothetical protein
VKAPHSFSTVVVLNRTAKSEKENNQQSNAEREMERNSYSVKEATLKPLLFP